MVKVKEFKMIWDVIIFLGYAVGLVVFIGVVFWLIYLLILILDMISDYKIQEKNRTSAFLLLGLWLFVVCGLTVGLGFAQTNQDVSSHNLTSQSIGVSDE